MAGPLSLNDATASLLREAFGSSRHTIASLALSAGLSRRDVWERLTTAAPLDTGDVDRIAAALEVDPLALMTRACDRAGT